MALGVGCGAEASDLPSDAMAAEKKYVDDADRRTVAESDDRQTRVRTSKRRVRCIFTPSHTDRPLASICCKEENEKANTFILLSDLQLVPVDCFRRLF